MIRNIFALSETKYCYSVIKKKKSEKHGLNIFTYKINKAINVYSFDWEKRQKKCPTNIRKFVINCNSIPKDLLKNL